MNTGTEKGTRPDSIWDERLDLRCFYLRLVKRLWMLPAGLLLGAVIGYALYYGCVTLRREQAYRSAATLQLTFAKDETGSVYDFYNAYTWDNMLLPSEEILGGAVENVAGEAFRRAHLTAEEYAATEALPLLLQAGTEEGKKALESWLLDAAEAELPSDVRLMRIVVTAAEPALTRLAAHAFAESVCAYGDAHPEFTAIEVIGMQGPEAVRWSDRTRVAAVSGGLCGLLAAFFAMLIAHTADEAVYVPEEATARFALPVVGVLPGDAGGDGGKTGVRALPAFLQKELAANWARITENGTKPVCLVSALADAEEAEKETAAARALLRTLLPDAAGKEETEMKEGAAAETGEPEAGNREKTVRLLIVEAGRKSASLTRHRAVQEAAMGIPYDGILFTGADSRFLEKYYHV